MNLQCKSWNLRSSHALKVNKCRFWATNIQTCHFLGTCWQIPLENYTIVWRGQRPFQTCITCAAWSPRLGGDTRHNTLLYCDTCSTAHLSVCTCNKYHVTHWTHNMQSYVTIWICSAKAEICARETRWRSNAADIRYKHTNMWFSRHMLINWTWKLYYCVKGRKTFPNMYHLCSLVVASRRRYTT